eukprot:529401_1
MGNSTSKKTANVSNTQIIHQIQPQTIKLAVMGDCLTGKTTLICKYVFGIFGRKYKPTTVADQYVKDITINCGNDKVPIRLEIWDFPGSLELNNLDYKSFWRFINGVIFVYDVTQKQSFSSVDILRKDFIKCVSETNNISFMLLANKNDFQHLNSQFINPTHWNFYDPKRLIYRYCKHIGNNIQKIIPVEVIKLCHKFYGEGRLNVGELYAQKFDMLWYETSSQLNENIHEAFSSIAKRICILQQQQKRERWNKKPYRRSIFES